MSKQISVSYLKSLRREELNDYSVFLKKWLITSIKKNGGHYAAPLGVVEMTLAIHYVFDSPYDKIIWDTGHQAYCHKMITGRYTSFDRLRRTGGISGFPNPKESEHDHFGVGHAATSLGVALGFCLSQKHLAERPWIIPVVGDAAFVSGTSLESLNFISEMAGKICIILNDNGYSISPSVGALTASHQYEQLSKAFNIKYINVEDGHDVSELVRLLEYVKQSEQICLIRIKTIKGHGDSEAIQDPEKYHQITAEQVLKLNETFQTNFVSILNHEGENNKKVKVLTPGMKLAAGLNSFKHKEQIIDLGIAEATTITVAGALSVSGDTPVVHLYSTFLQRGTDQLIHDIGIQNIPVILVIDRTGLAGTDGPTHHGIYDLSILTSIQSCKIYSFSSYRCFESTLRFYINNMKDFVALRIFKGQEINWSLINKGKAITHVNSDGLVNNIIHKKGDGCLIFLTHGRAAQLVLNLELLLAGVGKSSSIMEIVQLKPLELNEELEFIKNHKLIVIIEETIENGSLGQKFKSLISCENNWPSLLHFFINDAYVGEDIVETQWENSGLNVDHILKQINQIFSTD